jgi:electron transport complex protein RnfB
MMSIDRFDRIGMVARWRPVHRGHAPVLRALRSRCQMEAVRLDNGKAALDLDRCIGCGLCVITCPTESLSLLRKPEAEQPYVPKDIVDQYIKMGQARGKMGIGELIGMQVRSKLDRLLAPR